MKAEKTEKSEGGVAKVSAIAKKVALSPELAQFIGAPEESRSQVVKKLWDYIKKHNLQAASNKQMIMPDATLAPILGSDALHMTAMPGKLSKHYPPKKK